MEVKLNVNLISIYLMPYVPPPFCLSIFSKTFLTFKASRHNLVTKQQESRGFADTLSCCHELEPVADFLLIVEKDTYS